MQKHGVCATSQGIPGLSDEFDYFNLGLTLHSNYDVLVLAEYILICIINFITAIIIGYRYCY